MSSISLSPAVAPMPSLSLVGTSTHAASSPVPCGREDGKHFENLVERHRAMLAGYARRLARNPSDAEDLVQETLLRAYTHRHSLRETGSIASWLCVTLRHLFINQQRRLSRLPRPVSLDEGNFPEVASPPGTDPEVVVLKRWEHAAVHQATAALPEFYRTPLLLADQEGLSYQEIADRLDLPLGTVRSRISRARQRVQRSIYAWRGAILPRG